MVDQCDNCDYMRPRAYGEQSVLECRRNAPSTTYRQGQVGQWAEVKPDDWCSEYAPIGVNDPENWSIQGLTLNDTIKTKVAETPGHILWITNIDVTNTATGKGIMVKFFDGNTEDIIGVCSVAPGQSISRTVFPLAKAGTGEIWAQLDSAGNDVYVYVSVRQGSPIGVQQT